MQQIISHSLNDLKHNKKELRFSKFRLERFEKHYTKNRNDHSYLISKIIRFLDLKPNNLGKICLSDISEDKNQYLLHLGQCNGKCLQHFDQFIGQVNLVTTSTSFRNLFDLSELRMNDIVLKEFKSKTFKTLHVDNIDFEYISKFYSLNNTVEKLIVLLKNNLFENIENIHYDNSNLNLEFIKLHEKVNEILCYNKFLVFKGCMKKVYHTILNKNLHFNNLSPDYFLTIKGNYKGIPHIKLVKAKEFDCFNYSYENTTVVGLSKYEGPHSIKLYDIPFLHKIITKFPDYNNLNNDKILANQLNLYEKLYLEQNLMNTPLFLYNDHYLSFDNTGISNIQLKDLDSDKYYCTYFNGKSILLICKLVEGNKTLFVLDDSNLEGLYFAADEVDARFITYIFQKFNTVISTGNSKIIFHNNPGSNKIRLLITNIGNKLRLKFNLSPFKNIKVPQRYEISLRNETNKHLQQIPNYKYSNEVKNFDIIANPIKPEIKEKLNNLGEELFRLSWKIYDTSYQATYDNKKSEKYQAIAEEASNFILQKNEKLVEYKAEPKDDIKEIYWKIPEEKQFHKTKTAKNLSIYTLKNICFDESLKATLRANDVSIKNLRLKQAKLRKQESVYYLVDKVSNGKKVKVNEWLKFHTPEDKIHDVDIEMNKYKKSYEKIEEDIKKLLPKKTVNVQKNVKKQTRKEQKKKKLAKYSKAKSFKAKNPYDSLSDDSEIEEEFVDFDKTDESVEINKEEKGKEISETKKSFNEKIFEAFKKFKINKANKKQLQKAARNKAYYISLVQNDPFYKIKRKKNKEVLPEDYFEKVKALDDKNKEVSDYYEQKRTIADVKREVNCFDTIYSYLYTAKNRNLTGLIGAEKINPLSVFHTILDQTDSTTKFNIHKQRALRILGQSEDPYSFLSSRCFKTLKKYMKDNLYRRRNYFDLSDSEDEGGKNEMIKKPIINLFSQ